MLYSFLHGMSTKDSGTLQSLASWMIDSWKNASHVFDLEALTAVLSEAEKEELWKDCDTIVAHLKEGRHRDALPKSAVIDKVYSKFREVIARTSLATSSWS